MVVLWKIEIFIKSVLHRALLSGDSGIVGNKEADTAASGDILLSQDNISWRHSTPAATIRKLFKTPAIQHENRW